MLPIASRSEKVRMRARGLFGPCLYRRVMIWVVTSLIVVAIVLFKTQDVGVYDVAVNLPGGFGHAPAAQGSANGPSTPQQLNQQVNLTRAFCVYDSIRFANLSGHNSKETPRATWSKTMASAKRPKRRGRTVSNFSRECLGWHSSSKPHRRCPACTRSLLT